MNKAKKVKNDEFYTLLEDIEKELSHYKIYFKDKIVLCNCDDPTWSAFWKYFHLNFAELGLKKLISTHYDREEATYKMEYTGGDDNDIETGVKTPLEGNGDFRNQECLNLIDECDIVVTNPPFSDNKIIDLINIIEEKNKKYIIIIPTTKLTSNYIFNLIKSNKLYITNKIVNFKTPDNTIKVNNCLWINNIIQINPRKKYEKKNFEKYDDYNAINIDLVRDIPLDYDGLMGVPITFLIDYDPKQFEIIELIKPHLKGKTLFSRVIIKKLI